MKCLICNTDKEMEIKRENFRHSMFGLTVTLINVEIMRCAQCGEFEVIIPKLEELNELINTINKIKPSICVNLYFLDGWKIQNHLININTNKENI